MMNSNRSVRRSIGLVLPALLACLFCVSEVHGQGKTKASGSKSKVQTKKGSQDKDSKKQKEPNYITVQHILIGFQGSVPGKRITRTKKEAEALAKKLLEEAKKKGADFDKLVKENTDDSHPGIYQMANFGVKGNRAKRIYERAGMVPAFGDVGFPLKVGQVGLAVYDAKKSKYGWHIIKRIK